MIVKGGKDNPEYQYTNNSIGLSMIIVISFYQNNLTHFLAQEQVKMPKIVNHKSIKQKISKCNYILQQGKLAELANLECGLRYERYSKLKTLELSTFEKTSSTYGSNAFSPIS